LPARRKDAFFANTVRQWVCDIAFSGRKNGQNSTSIRDVQNAPGLVVLFQGASEMAEMRARLSQTAISQELGVSISTVSRWVSSGVRGRVLRSILIGGRRYVLREDLDHFLGNSPPEVHSEVAPAGETSVEAELRSRFDL